MSIGERITALRGEMSRKIFSKRIGIVENTLRNYEQGLSLPNSDVIAIICTEFSINVEWLVTGTGPMRRDEVPVQSGAADGRTRQEMEARIKELELELLVAKRMHESVLQQLLEMMAKNMIEKHKASEFNILGNDPNKKNLTFPDQEDPEKS